MKLKTLTGFFLFLITGVLTLGCCSIVNDITDDVDTIYELEQTMCRFHFDHVTYHVTKKGDTLFVIDRTPCPYLPTPELFIDEMKWIIFMDRYIDSLQKERDLIYEQINNLK